MGSINIISKRSYTPCCPFLRQMDISACREKNGISLLFQAGLEFLPLLFQYRHRSFGSEIRILISMTYCSSLGLNLTGNIQVHRAVQERKIGITFHEVQTFDLRQDA